MSVRKRLRITASTGRGNNKTEAILALISPKNKEISSQDDLAGYLGVRRPRICVSTLANHWIQAISRKWVVYLGKGCLFGSEKFPDKIDC